MTRHATLLQFFLNSFKNLFNLGRPQSSYWYCFILVSTFTWVGFVWVNTVCTALLCMCIIAVIEKSTSNNCNSLTSLVSRDVWGFPVWLIAICELNLLINWRGGIIYCTALLCMPYISGFMDFYIMLKN